MVSWAVAKPEKSMANLNYDFHDFLSNIMVVSHKRYKCENAENAENCIIQTQN